MSTLNLFQGFGYGFGYRIREEASEDGGEEGYYKKVCPPVDYTGDRDQGEEGPDIGWVGPVQLGGTPGGGSLEHAEACQAAQLNQAGHSLHFRNTLLAWSNWK